MIARYFVIIPMLTIITLSIFADEYFIPDWFYESHQYWRNGLVSDREFVDAISYLQKIDLLR
ncbi:MAG: hypothetical protein QXE84_09430, partial [Candidatus Nitrosotenuis sp.]